jgi:heat shock protein HslJ
MRKIAYLALAAAAPVLLAQPAFAKGRPGGAPQQSEEKPAEKKEAYESPFPTKMNWVLASANGKNAPAEATMAIDENLRGTGSGGCNNWSAALYPVKGHRLAMGPVAMTKKTCTPEINAFEKLFLTVLHTGPTWELKGSVLTVKSQAGTLVFNRGL